MFNETKRQGSFGSPQPQQQTFRQMQQQGVARPGPSNLQSIAQRVMGWQGAPSTSSGVRQATNKSPSVLYGPGGASNTNAGRPIHSGPQPQVINPNQGAWDKGGRMTNQGSGGWLPPAPQQPQTPTPAPQQPTSDSMYERLLANLNNPGRYNSDMAVETYGRLNNLLTEGYDIERDKLREEMARRGLGDSTIYGGRLGDLGVQQARAQQDLAQEIAREQAMTWRQDYEGALRDLLGYQQQGFDNQLDLGRFDRESSQWQQQLLMQLLGAT